MPEPMSHRRSTSSERAEAIGRRSESGGSLAATSCCRRYPRSRAQAETIVSSRANAICTSGQSSYTVLAGRYATGGRRLPRRSFVLREPRSMPPCRARSPDMEAAAPQALVLYEEKGHLVGIARAKVILDAVGRQPCRESEKK